MPKYRKRPVEIEAFQWLESAIWPEWFHAAVDAGIVDVNPEEKMATISTLEGEMDAHLKDWVIRGVKGEIYPCKPDIFDITYEPMENSNV